MKLRIALTVALAFLLGAQAYIAEWSYQQEGSLHATLTGVEVVVPLLVLTILAGALVGRFWVLFALLGPIASLGYLQSTGHIGPDGISPLTSPPGIAHIVWLGVMLLLGLAVASFYRYLRKARGQSELRSA